MLVTLLLFAKMGKVSPNVGYIAKMGKVSPNVGYIAQRALIVFGFEWNKGSGVFDQTSGLCLQCIQAFV